MTQEALESLAGRKVIVTGGAGFIGSHLCEELVKVGADVVCIDDLSAGKRGNVDLFKGRNNFTFAHKDICDTDEEMKALFAA